MLISIWFLSGGFGEFQIINCLTLRITDFWGLFTPLFIFNSLKEIWTWGSILVLEKRETLILFLSGTCDMPEDTDFYILQQRWQCILGNIFTSVAFLEIIQWLFGKIITSLPRWYVSLIFPHWILILSWLSLFLDTEHNFFLLKSYFLTIFKNFIHLKEKSTSRGRGEADSPWSCKSDTGFHLSTWGDHDLNLTDTPSFNF